MPGAIWDLEKRYYKAASIHTGRALVNFEDRKESGANFTFDAHLKLIKFL